MADHQEQPDQDIRVQAFLEWMNRNYCFEILGFDHPNKPTKQKFLPKDAVITYFGTQAGRKLLEGIIEAVVPVQTDLFLTPEDILPDHIQVFCTLLNISEGKWIEWFRRYENLQDSSLPLASDSSPPDWPMSTIGEALFFDKFSREQWKFCVPVLKPFVDRHFHEDRVLPIISKEFLAHGSDATFWRIKLHPLYNKLINEDEKKQLGPLANTFVLKSFTPNSEVKTIYDKDIQLFRKIDDTPSNTKLNIISLHSSFIRGNSHNLLLEYADKGNLEDYFKKEQPPRTKEEVIRFWKALFKIILALKIIHECIRVNGGERGFGGFQVWHQNLTPENILVVSNGSEDVRDWEFKLANPGSSYFKVEPNSSTRLSSAGSRTYGTQTYGSPERYRSQDNSSPDRFRSGEAADIWSLGCIFSEAARWVEEGYHGVREYRRARQEEKSRLAGSEYSACFHDGEKALEAVDKSHNLSRIDPFSKYDPTRLVVDHMISPAIVDIKMRLTLSQLWKVAAGIEEQLENDPSSLHIASIDQAQYYALSVGEKARADQYRYLERKSNLPSLGSSPYTIEDVLGWKRNRPNSTTDHIHNPILDPSILGRLKDRFHIILIDDSESMKPCWKDVVAVTEALTYILTDVDPDSVFIVMAKDSMHPGRTSNLFAKFVRDHGDNLQGQADISLQLGIILDACQNDLIGKSTLPFSLNLRETHLTPLNLYILTNGVWKEDCTPEYPIRGLVAKLNELGKGNSEVGIHFISFGNDARGLKRMHYLDSGLGLDPDIVNHEHWTGDVLKMLLGSTSNNWDKKNATQPSTPLPPIRDSTMDYDDGYHESFSSDDEGTNRHNPQVFQNSISRPDRNSEVLRKVQDSGYGTSIQDRLTSKIDISSVYTGEVHAHIASHNDPHGWDDTRSVVSVIDDIHSQVSTRRTPQEVTAENHLSLLLAQNKELKPLYEAALANIGKERLVNNLRKLLKQYYLELSMNAKTNLERAAVQLLRSRWSRIRIAEQISHLLAPINEEHLEQQLKEIDVHRPDLDAWIDNNAAFVPAEEVKTRANELPDQDNLFEDDLERLIDESSSEEEDTEKKISPRISEVEKFLVEGSPFHRLSANFLTFLLPSSLSSLTRELMTIPSERIWFSDEEDNSFLNKFKTVIESVTEEDWHWWPLRPKMRMLQKGQTRIHWQCHCGTHLWAEISKSQSERYKSLLPLRGTNIPHEHLCSPGQRNTLGVTLRRCISQFVTAAPSSSPATITSNIPLGSLNQVDNQGTQQNITSTGSLSSTSRPPHNVASDSQQGTATSIFAGTNRELVVLFGVHGARRTLELAQIDALKYSNDSTFFHELRKKYKELRGWRYWLSIWQLKHCDFVKFDKIEADRILLNKKNDLPEDFKLYEYNPRPPNVDVPPISTHQFEYRLLRHCNTSCSLSLFHDCVKPPAGEWALGRIPKRTHALELQTNEPDTAWGIQAQFRPHALLVFSYHLVPLVGGLAFWGWWQWTHPGDLQDATAPLIVVATLMALLWSSIAVLYLFR